MQCPVCGREAATDEQPLADGVTVFCCDRCATGVLRTFAFHEDTEETDGTGHRAVS